MKRESDADKLARRAAWKKDFTAVIHFRKMLIRMGRPGPEDIAGMMMITADDYAVMERVLRGADRCLKLEAGNARV